MPDRTCSVEDCDRPHYGRTWCEMHYQRWRKNGDPSVVASYPSHCTFDGCERPHSGRGWCAMHLARWRKHGDPSVLAHKTLSEHPNWVGDAAKCDSVHARVRRARGRASEHVCPCGSPAVDWAYDHACPNEQVEVVRKQGRLVPIPFSTDLDRYQALCRRCHRRLDLSHARSRAAG